jgi:hypothetical protein
MLTGRSCPVSSKADSRSLAGFGICTRTVPSAKADSFFSGVFPALPSVCENSSFAPLGLDQSHLYPRLKPWALFFRRFAARNCWLCSTLNLQSEISRTHFRAGLSHIAATRLAFALDKPLRFSEQLGRVLVSFSPAVRTPNQMRYP